MGRTKLIGNKVTEECIEFIENDAGFCAAIVAGLFKNKKKRQGLSLAGVQCMASKSSTDGGFTLSFRRGTVRYIAAFRLSGNGQDVVIRSHRIVKLLLGGLLLQWQQDPEKLVWSGDVVKTPTHPQPETQFVPAYVPSNPFS